ncbi:MAG: hypothetical protein ABI678_12345 [Kofleriaceae bacterium]
MSDPFQTVIRCPRSVAARTALLAHWLETNDARAELLRLSLVAHLTEPGLSGEEGNDAAYLVYKRGKELAGAIAGIVKTFDFELGLVAATVIPAIDLQADARRYFDAAPLIALGVSDPADARDVVNNPALAQIVDLDFRGRGIDDELARAIAVSDQMAEVRILDLSHGTITHAGLEALTASTKLPNLISLEVTGNPCETAVNEVEGRYFWIAPAGRTLWQKAFHDQLLSSAAWSTASLTWPPVFDTYAWTA